MWQNFLPWIGGAWLVLPALVLGILYWRSREPSAEKQKNL